MAAMKEMFDEHTTEINTLFSVKGRVALITGGTLGSECLIFPH